MAQNMGQLTDMWMVNPTMFDPTQAQNQFSNYNNQPMPWPPTYNTGAGGPVNAATGQPIQSFQAWQQQNPGGLSINSTPAQPQAAPAPGVSGTGWWGGPFQTPANSAQAAAGQAAYADASRQSCGFGNIQTETNTPGMANYFLGQSVQGSQNANAQPPAAPQASGPPNNWYAALNALSNPGNPQTMGANVPLQTGYQPAGGVNNAFLQQAGAGQGMNQGFLSALRSIQGRPQGGM